MKEKKSLKEYLGGFYFLINIENDSKFDYVYYL